MSILEAQQMFEITDISLEDKKSLNKKYKTLAKKYHPDTYKDDDGDAFKKLSEAYDMLLELIKQLETFEILNKVNIREEKLIHITYEELLQVYKGEHKTLTKSDLNKNRVLIIFTVSTLYKQDIQTITAVVLKNIEDKYEILLEVEDDDIFKPSCIDVKIAKDDFHIDLSYTSTKYTATLEQDIRISITVNKKFKRQ